MLAEETENYLSTSASVFVIKANILVMVLIAAKEAEFSLG